MKLKNIIYDDLSVGMFVSRTSVVKESDICLFALVSGDSNPIHFDEQYAEKSRFGGRLAHGVIFASFISATIGSQLPGPGSIYLSQTLNFVKPVFIGEEVTTIVTIKEKKSSFRVVLDCRCLNNVGDVVVEGVATVIAPTEHVEMDHLRLKLFTSHSLSEVHTVNENEYITKAH